MCNKPTAASQSLLLLKVLMALDISTSTPRISRPLRRLETSFGKAHWCKYRAWAGSHLSEQLTTLANAKTTCENPEFFGDGLLAPSGRAAGDRRAGRTMQRTLWPLHFWKGFFASTTIKTQVMTACSDHYAWRLALILDRLIPETHHILYRAIYWIRIYIYIYIFLHVHKNTTYNECTCSICVCRALPIDVYNIRYTILFIRICRISIQYTCVYIPNLIQACQDICKTWKFICISVCVCESQG